jgi:hypothetical protein
VTRYALARTGSPDDDRVEACHAASAAATEDSNKEDSPIKGHLHADSVVADLNRVMSAA